MARHDPPTRQREIDAIHDRLARRGLTPLLCVGPILKTLEWATMGSVLYASLIAIIVSLIVFVVSDFAYPFVLFIAGGVCGVLAFLGGARAWAMAHDPTPAYGWQVKEVLQAIKDSPRLVAQVDAWLCQSGLGSLSQAQVSALDQAHTSLRAIELWEQNHRETHACLEEELGSISRIRRLEHAQGLEDGLPPAHEAAAPARL